MIVLKFGGSSVQDREMIDRAIDITAGQIDRAPLLVASAMGKTTDALVRTGACARDGRSECARQELSALTEHHYGTARSFLTGDNLAAAESALESLFHELSSLVKGLLLLREFTFRSSDALLSFGELLSTTLIYHRMIERGIPAEFLDSRQLIRTDEQFTAAVPLMTETAAVIRDRVHPEPGKILVAQGFIASTLKGVTTTLGRGGSDYTATIYGSALRAEEVQIWTDVNGIMTSDPRVVQGVRTIPVISYEEASELAYFGAKVVHPSTIQPAIEIGIPVLVKNTRNPDGAATRIIARAEGEGLRALAGKKSITLINVNSKRMLNAFGFLSRIFAIFEKYRTSVDLIATSEVSVSMTVDNDTQLEDIVRELSEIGTVGVEYRKGIICLVGQNLWKDSAFIARVFGALSSTPIRMISLGSSDINLSLVVPEEKLDDSIRVLHREFFPEP